MGSESIAHEAEGQTGYWLRGHETKQLYLVKARLQAFFAAKKPALCATSGL